MLKMTTRFVLAGLVAAQIGGCASYKQGAFPTFDQESGAKEETVEIRVGSEVEIVMITGEKRRARLFAFQKTNWLSAGQETMGLKRTRLIDRILFESKSGKKPG
jgi:hypothetical protein